MLTGLCFFVVCLQLQQCVRFAEYFERHVGDYPLDMFYYESDWSDTEPYQIDLSKLILYEPSLHQDADALHSTALNWGAYYHYRYEDRCKHLLKFEHDIAFAAPAEFDYLSMFEADIRKYANETLLVYGRECAEQQHAAGSLQLIIDKFRFLEFLDLYTLHSMLSAESRGSEAGLEKFIDTYEGVTGKQDVSHARHERLWKSCEQTEKREPNDWAFVHCDGGSDPACRNLG